MRQVSRFYNHSDESVLISVEVIGDQVRLQPKEECHVLVFGQTPCFTEVSFGGTYVAVYPSPKCEVAVFMNGQLIAGSLDFIDPNWSEIAKAEYRAWIEELGPEQIRT